MMPQDESYSGLNWSTTACAAAMRPGRDSRSILASAPQWRGARSEEVKMAWTWKAGLAGLVIVAASTDAPAQTAPSRPYAGMQARTIKPLSDEQIADLKAGRGMRLALAAELNGYPGPSHVLELVAQLNLSDRQRGSVRQLFAAMKAESIPIGEQLISRESDLDRLFADRTITPEGLKAAIAEIGNLQAGLRAAHLKY